MNPESAVFLAFLFGLLIGVVTTHTARRHPSRLPRAPGIVSATSTSTGRSASRQLHWETPQLRLVRNEPVDWQREGVL